MYLEETKNKLPGQRILVKYDCDNSCKNCNQQKNLIFKVAQKNFEVNKGKHICKSCTLAAKNPMKRKEVQEKIKQTNLERYGTTCSMNTQERIAERSEKFKDPEFVAQWAAKRKETCLELYGTEFAQQNKIIKEKQRQTMQERYGVDHPYQSPKIMDRMKASNLEKYGVENVASLPEVQIKIAQTTLTKYGVERYNQLPEMKDYLREHCKEWLAESYASGGPNKGIERPEEWNQKQRETIAKLIDEGNWHSGSKNSLKGRYQSKKCVRKSPMFRSSYELKLHVCLDNDETVVFYDYEPFQISYYDTEGKKRHYTIDFIVRYSSGQLVCIEIKNNYNKEEFITGGKYVSIRELCSENNMELRILANEEIAALGLDLKQLLLLKEVELFE